jgi:hypothetical protein
MPVYTVELNGKTFDIEGPAGASIAQLKAAAQAHDASSSAPKENTLVQEAGRQLGLSARAAANVVASPLTLGGNFIGKTVNALAGQEVFKPSTDVVDAWLTKAGLPQAERPIEKFTQDVAKSAPALAIPAGAAPQVAGNALVGATLAPSGEEATGAAGGAFGGLLGHVLPKAISKGLPGVSPQARQLMDTTNVQPTVGMAIPRLKAAEEFLTGVPLVGEAARSARQRAIGEFSTEAISRAVPRMPAGQFKGKGPFEQIDAANDYVSQMFYDTLPKVMPEAPSGAYSGLGGSRLSPSAASFEAGYQKALQNSYLTDAQRDIIKRVYADRGPKISSYTGEQLKTLDAELGEQIRKYQRGAGTSDLADALAEMQLGLRQGIEQRLPPDMQGTLSEANRAYRELIALNDAASKSPELVVTPQRLAKAMAARDKKPVTRLQGPTAEFVRGAESVIPNSPGARGISSPGLTSAAAGTGLALLFDKLPALLAAGGGAFAGSTRPAQAALTGNLALQRALRRQLETSPTILPALTGAAFREDE